MAETLVAPGGAGPGGIDETLVGTPDGEGDGRAISEGLQQLEVYANTERVQRDVGRVVLEVGGRQPMTGVRDLSGRHTLGRYGGSLTVRGLFPEVRFP